MDTDLSPSVASGARVAHGATPPETTAAASAIIGSEAFVQRVLRAMTLGARRAIEENAALERRPNVS